MIDYNQNLFDPVYSILGVPANLTTGSGIVQITVIDKTRAKMNVSNTIEIHSVGPGCRARIPELTANGVEVSDCIGNPISFNNGFWVIRDTEMLGNPNGEDQGEVLFLLRSNSS